MYIVSPTLVPNILMFKLLPTINDKKKAPGEHISKFGIIGIQLLTMNVKTCLKLIEKTMIYI